MSLAGLKKQFNKANQYMSEKIGGAKGTELDDDFMEMERRIDVMEKLVADLINKTQEFLQPNPASRAKIFAANSFSKMRGQAKNTSYPQPEGTLGEHMIKHGKDLGEEMEFGSCLVEAGESFKQLADLKYSMEDTVKQNFLEPLGLLQAKDIKEVNHHRKKLSGRRLDFDCKRRKKDKESGAQKSGSTITDEEIRVAEEKFEESKELAETAMFNLLENDVEQIAQLQSFVEAEVEYHRSAVDVLQSLLTTLETKRNHAMSRPKSEHVPKRASIRNRTPSPANFYESTNDFDKGSTNSYSFNSSPQYAQAEKKQPCCEAVYDFDPENEGELGFKEGDVINLISQIDENWYEGSIHGTTGYFPVNYVTVIVDLPH
ncbi:endophilin-A3-like isoform X1 [Ylistrum balloti]|uniref:endophilin-A3-like isoform X1 n=1 Tax=Ylistrum balloti TaxID=509963 RepID=UPI002905B807|nr:endophilin-A3-like isoform X1 [Ylistrum balloti]